MTNSTIAPIESAAATVGLDAAEADIMARLVAQYQSHQIGNDMRTLAYLGKRTLRAAGLLGMAMPPSLSKLETVLGWPAKAVTSLEHRLNGRGFVLPGATGLDEGLAEIAADNDLEVTQSMTHTSALIHGCAFVTVTAGDEEAGDPPVVISARSAREATALWSRRSRRVIAGLTINRGEGPESDQVVLWLPDRIVTMTRVPGGWSIYRQAHRLGQVPMEIMAFRPHLEREFGMSRISGTVMDLTASAARTVLRMEGTAEFFSFPQRYGLGLNDDDFADTFKTYLNRFLAIGRDEDGQLPEMGQFSPSSPEPHIAQLRATGMLFSGETGIPLNHLGIVHDNPSSADAIRAAEGDLVTIAERATTNFGPKWASIMGMAHQIREGTHDPRMKRLMMQWRDPSTPTKAASAQSVMALISVGALDPRSPVTWELLGFDAPTISRLEADAARMDARDALAALATAPGGPDTADADELALAVDVGEPAGTDPKEVKAKADALGALIRAGVDPASAAGQVGLSGLTFTGATPVSLRQPEAIADRLEEK